MIDVNRLKIGKLQSWMDFLVKHLKPGDEEMIIC